MAQYKNLKFISPSTSSAFETRYAPGTHIENPGIYRCTGCSDEIVVARGQKLPAAGVHQHTPDAKVEWQLLVLAEQHRN
ncbi:MAG: hypothetical protein M3Q69_16705 [Acidobacteriota bacterium]|nr:hypothetical protein [Acidobacteriota bacterium]